VSRHERNRFLGSKIFGMGTFCSGKFFERKFFGWEIFFNKKKFEMVNLGITFSGCKNFEE
jgi:hypothetical protein